MVYVEARVIDTTSKSSCSSRFAEERIQLVVFFIEHDKRLKKYGNNGLRFQEQDFLSHFQNRYPPPLTKNILKEDLHSHARQQNSRHFQESNKM